MKPAPPRALDTRRIILDAAERVLRTKGLMGASTREIAREAGCADGTLYVHFADRIDLFVALLDSYLPQFVEPLRRLNQMVGRRTVRRNLQEVLEATLAWQVRIGPLVGALTADPALLKAFLERIQADGGGPHHSIAAVERYIVAEQKLGRIEEKANARGVAMIILGTPHYWVAISPFLQSDAKASPEFVKQTLDSLMIGLRPRRARITAEKCA